MKDLCIFLQLHNKKLIPELLSYIDKVYEQIKDFDLYITIIEEISLEIIEKYIENVEWIENIKNIDLFEENRGMDVGGFLWQLNHLNLKKDQYLCLLKLQTKTDDKSRYNMIEPLVTNIKSCIDKFKKFPKLGMIGGKNYILKNVEYEEYLITVYIEKILKKVCNNRIFIQGTMFICRFDAFHDLIHDQCQEFKDILKSCYTIIDKGRLQDNLPHSLERFFCYHYINNNYIISGV